MRFLNIPIFLFVLIMLLHSCKDNDSVVEAALPVVGADYFTGIENHRRALNEFFLSANSPLSDSIRKEFAGLKYYAIDTNFRVIADFEEIKNGPVFTIQATGTIADIYKTMGNLHFVLGGNKYSLEVYRNESMEGKGEEVFFIPFYDLTNGKETYGGGRYLDIAKLEDSKIVLDFNSAYNPYCVFNHEYSCPVPPLQNSLKTEIKAGERL